MSARLISFRRRQGLAQAQLGDAFLATYPAAIPGEWSRHPVPMIVVDHCTNAEYEAAPADDPDLSRQHTNIYFRSPEARLSAERIARDLALTRMATLYPADQDVLVIVGAKHRVTLAEARPS